MSSRPVASPVVDTSAELLKVCLSVCMCVCVCVPLQYCGCLLHFVHAVHMFVFYSHWFLWRLILQYRPIYCIKTLQTAMTYRVAACPLVTRWRHCMPYCKAVSMEIDHLTCAHHICQGHVLQHTLLLTSKTQSQRSLLGVLSPAAAAATCKSAFKVTAVTGLWLYVRFFGVSRHSSSKDRPW